jgi:hypothetical protein
MQLSAKKSGTRRITPSTSFTRAMPLRRRDECLGSRDNKSIAGAGLESYLLYSIMCRSSTAYMVKLFHDF